MYDSRIKSHYIDNNVWTKQTDIIGKSVKNRGTKDNDSNRYIYIENILNLYFTFLKITDRKSITVSVWGLGKLNRVENIFDSNPRLFRLKTRGAKIVKVIKQLYLPILTWKSFSLEPKVFVISCSRKMFFLA